MAADRADLPAAGAAAAGVVAGGIAAVRRRVCPPSCIDIVRLFRIFQSVPQLLPQAGREKERENLFSFRRDVFEIVLFFRKLVP